METKIVGLLMLFLGVYLFSLGLRIDDSECYHLLNVRLIGTAILLLMLGFVFLISDKTFCEIYGVFC